MAIKIGSNFTFQGKQPNFERDRFATKAAMKAFPETSIDDGHLSYCSEDGNTYQFKSSNSVDAVTGKWRLFKTDVDVPIMKGTTATADGVAGLVPAPKIGDRFAWLQATGVWKNIDVADVPTLTNRVLINGNQSGTIGSNSGIFKIATITIPKLANITGTLEFDIQSRRDNFNIMVNISYNTYFDLVVKVKDNSLISNKTPFYYYVDKTKDIDDVTLYYKFIQYDAVNVKVTSKTGLLNLSYTIDNIKVDALPEGAIQVHNVNYGNKNLFYATPKDVAGDPNFRAIDITDLPDLSSKYATKEKAFTKDTASTEPGQFVAGPINTRGNISLRKIDISDIPDLRSKYQKLDGNGYQEKAKVAGLIVKHGNTGDTGSGYLIAEVDQSVGGQMGPDWYYATDGTLQDIKTKIPKVVLDDAVSTTSDNGVKNSVITKYVDGKVTTINDSIADVRTSLESTQTDFVDLRNKVNAMPKTVFITQDAYNALTTKDPNTIYYING